MENYEISKYIDDFNRRLIELKNAIRMDLIIEQINNLEKQMVEPDFWNDAKHASSVNKEIKMLKDRLNTYNDITENIEELELYFEMHKSEEENLMSEIENLIPTLEKKLSDFEIKMLLSKEYDASDCIIELHPGAGGTESQDWTQMLYRMYRRYAERHGFEFELVDYLDGDEAGIKSATFILHGDMAYGYLKSEQGVHRLIRISPFDSNARRHTSFSSVSIIPVIENDFNIDIKTDDVRIDTYRSSGAGGQHINKTDSAVRLTHLPTGIVVTCQNQRSQIQNKEKAFAILKSRLYQLEKEEQDRKLRGFSDTGAENGFGSQIRTYTLHPFTLIKDSRTKYEEYNATAVLDGEIDGFINSYLKSEFNVR